MKKLLYICFISTIAIQQSHGASIGLLGRCAQTIRCLFARNANTAVLPMQEDQHDQAHRIAQGYRIAHAKFLLTANVQHVLTGNDSVTNICKILQNDTHSAWPSALITAIDRDLFYVLTKDNGQAALKTIVEHNNDASNAIVKGLNRTHQHAVLILAHEHPEAFAFLCSQLCKTGASKASIVSQLNSRGAYPISPGLCERMVTFMADESHNPIVAERITKTFTLGQYIQFMQHAPIQTAQLLQNLKNYGGNRLHDITLEQVMLTSRK